MELAEILKQPEGFTPPSVTVKIEKVFAYKSGESDNGPWSFQDIQVAGGKLKLKGLLREFPSSRVGQTVTIHANQSKQHGLTGMKVAHEEYQNKIYDKLIITSSAKWDWGAAETNSNGAVQSAPVAQNGVSSDTVYSDHILSCAELANLVMGNLCVEDPAAIQACFATICIDTKNRNILLPKPKTLAAAVETQEPEAGPEHEENPFEEELEDIPF